MAWNQSTGEAAKPQPKKPSALRGIIAGVVVVALSAGAYFAFFAGAERSEGDVPDSDVSRVVKIKETKPAAGPKVSQPAEAEKKVGKTEKKKWTAASGEVPTEWCGRPVVRSTVSTNEDGSVTMNMWTDDGNKHWLNIAPRPLFSDPVDQLIAMAVNTPSGSPLPPFPPIGPEMDAKFRKSVETPVTFSDDDTPEVRAAKENVAETRKQILELLDDGYKLEDILNDHRNLLNENIKIRSDCMREAQKIMASGDSEGARKYVNTMNIALQQMGIEGFSLEDTDVGSRRRAPQPSQQ